MLSHVIKRLSHIVLKPNLKIKKVLFGNTPVENKLIIQGPSGKELVNIHEGLNVKIYPSVVPNENQLTVSIDDDKIKTMSKYERKFVSSMWGTTRSMIRSNIEGVLDGHQVALRLVGVGYKASLVDRKIVLKIGYSHDVIIPIPSCINASIPNPTKIILVGSNLQKVTQLASIIRSKRKPEPFNGKGIFVGNETIKLKAGKKK